MWLPKGMPGAHRVTAWVPLLNSLATAGLMHSFWAHNKHKCEEVIAKRKKAEEKAATAADDAAEEAAAMAEVEAVAAATV